MSNKWSNRWRTFKSGADPYEDQALEREALEAEKMPVHPCTNRDCPEWNTLTAHYRPGVGGWWCVVCGELSKV